MPHCSRMPNPLHGKMKHYPSIPKRLIEDRVVYVFDKLDGSNIRAEWTRKQGFVRFGSRKRLLGPDQEFIHEAKALIKETCSQLVEDAFQGEAESAILFFEFYGANSFAGQHVKEDHNIALLDVNVHRRGLLRPDEFMSKFEGFPKAKLLHKGVLTPEIVEAVQHGRFPGVTNEGVVAKAIPEKRSHPP